MKYIPILFLISILSFASKPKKQIIYNYKCSGEIDSEISLYSGHYEGVLLHMIDKVNYVQGGSSSYLELQSSEGNEIRLIKNLNNSDFFNFPISSQSNNFFHEQYSEYEKSREFVNLQTTFHPAILSYKASVLFKDAPKEMTYTLSIFDFRKFSGPGSETPVIAYGEIHCLRYEN